MSQLARGALAALTLASLLGCPAKTLEVKIVPPKAAVAAIAVLPVEIGYIADPAEQVRRTHDVLTDVWANTTWRVLHPRQFRVINEGGSQFLTDTDLMIRGKDLGFDAREVAVLRARVSVREAQVAAVVSGGDKDEVGRDYQGHVDATLQLLSATGAVIADIKVVQEIDPFAERADWDKLPAARLALERGLAALREGCPTCFATGPRPSFDVFTNPAAVLNARTEDGSSLRQEIDASEGPEGDARLWNAMQYFRPDISLEEAKRLATVPPSACLGASPPHGLESGDCIIAAEGQTIWDPHALAWALARGGEVALTIIDTVGTSRIVLLAP